MKDLADHQFDRAARWLRHHAHEGRVPPSHILEKMEAQEKHLRLALPVECRQIDAVINAARERNSLATAAKRLRRP